MSEFQEENDSINKMLMDEINGEFLSELQIINKSMIEDCKSGDIKSIQRAIENGADVNSFAGKPLSEATINGHLDVVKVLIENGLDVDKALIDTSRNGNLEVMKLMIENGADVNANDILVKANPIIIASYNGHLEAVKLLHQNGADIDKAIEHADDRIKDELIDYKTSINEKAVLQSDLQSVKSPVQAPSRRI